MCKDGVCTMPKKPDPSKKKGSVYESQINASKKWEKEHPQEKLIIRLPEGSKDIIAAYVQQKSIEDPTNPKYSTSKGRPSVNALIRTLIESELGCKFEN